MAQFHDTVREELGEILSKLEEVYRRSHPNTALLFATDDASFTAQDVARAISALAPERGYATQRYSVYTHNINSGNQSVGGILATARMGLVSFGYQDRTEPEKKIGFEMNVTFGSRVTGYKLAGSDGQLRHGFTKDMVTAALEQIFSR